MADPIVSMLTGDSDPTPTYIHVLMYRGVGPLIALDNQAEAARIADKFPEMFTVRTIQLVMVNQ